MEFKTNKEFVDYINAGLPQSFNEKGMHLAAHVWHGLGRNITIDFRADARGLQEISHNNRFRISWMQHGCPEDGAYHDIYCFEKVTGFGKWTGIKNPANRRKKSFKFAADAIIAFFVKNEEKIWEAIYAD